MIYETTCIGGVVNDGLYDILTGAIEARMEDQGCEDRRMEPVLGMDVTLRVRVVGRTEEEALLKSLDEALGGHRRSVVAHGKNHGDDREVGVRLAFDILGWDDDVLIVDVFPELY